MPRKVPGTLSMLHERQKSGLRPGRTRTAWIPLLPTALSVAFLVAAAAGFAKAAPQAPAGCAAAGSGTAVYRIGAGDVLRVSVWNNKDMDRTVTVRPDGMISFPLLGDVHAAGLTPMRLQEVMSEGLKRYMADPQVAVVIQEIHSFQVSVLGQVQHPGRYEMRSDNVTVLDALAEAGGFTSFASRSGIRVLRHESDGTRRIPFRYDKAVSHNPGNADFCVRPGDIIIVP